MSEKTPSKKAYEDARNCTHRKLEGASDDGIVTLEKYFGTAMERKLKNHHCGVQSVSVGGLELASLPRRHQLRVEPKPAKRSREVCKGLRPRRGHVHGQCVGSEWDQPLASPSEMYLDRRVSRPKGGAKRGSETAGYCIPTWHGISHAWAPAAILEQEPKCPVTVNNVTFQPKDIKRLLTDVYYGAKSSTVFAGSRYNGNNDSTDQYGRHTDYSYRDLNPGFFHIAATNLLGLLNTTFFVDTDAGYEVHNRPVVGFKVYEQTAMSPQKAANAFYGLETYPWNANVTNIVYVKSRLSWINETEADGGLVASGANEKLTVGAYYDYLLELDESEEIIGGEWLYGSNGNHPDFLWFLQGKPPADTVTKIGLSYANVAKLLEKSVSC
ncbi:hypothetical protein PHYSODRAFT_261510 [Phytophthora sojae]|uniref:Uncharacterized protein n=1 Tax=Phytophthora sojae (strain P6497) TaxID=1094619 RepID=G4ZZV4_PHYSP|nr:hypothetical protein PHYSODRAFT_261510 [Phytophthora sojae]EGZ11251.1 hypothetical protein PHYSODRAFT_261510 [Phytophthora sojae]|eukprot:XP_009533996.1 hypothetical protein PHYSODRAFT_261510 [Phytophthora sojae]